jgi:hypothetical protein
MRDTEESGIVAPKWYDYEYLVDYVLIETKEGQNLLKNFMEAIWDNGNRT